MPLRAQRIFRNIKRMIVCLRLMGRFYEVIDPKHVICP